MVAHPAPERPIVGVGMRRSQTELGALVIDTDSGTPFSRPRPPTKHDSIMQDRNPAPPMLF
jgi:hypothetical protein